MIIDESGLAEFRAQYLAPGEIVEAIVSHVRILFRIGVGLGKSRAVDMLLAFPGLFHRFQLVVCVAPTWDILNEREILSGAAEPLVPMRVLRPRPVERCGPRAEAWAQLEQRGCSAYGKATLCRECPALRDESAPCTWPGQFRGLCGVGLVFGTEQQFMLNRSLVPFLKGQTRAARVLVILDEARLLDTSFEVALSAEDVGRFRELVTDLARPKGVPSRIAAEWLTSIGFICEADNRTLTSAHLELPAAMNRHACKIQSLGIQRYGRDFRYIGYELALLGWSRRGERRKDADGTIRFIARPYLGCHVLILSAHLRSDYTAHRLGASHIASPFEKTVFRHSGTRILNLRNRIGADRYFLKNRRQVLDTFAVLIARNIVEGQTTLLVCRKKSKALCAEYLGKRLAGWGLFVRFVCDRDASLPSPPQTTVIPIIHYGVLGVNNFADYESAYCLNSYYVSDRELSRTVQEAEPHDSRVKFRIFSGPHMLRHVEMERPARSDREWVRLAEMYLRRLEVDPAIQAVGRVRFLTKPREVVLFQMHNLGPEVGECVEVRTLLALRLTLGIPRARDVDEALEAARLRNSIKAGATVAEAAAEVGISRSTAFERLRSGESPDFPLIYSLRKFWTPTGAATSAGAVP